jgi:hypothetical protein
MTTTRQKIEDVMHIAACDEETAMRYLLAEEWCVTDAVYSYRADAKAAKEIRTALEAA